MNRIIVYLLALLVACPAMGGGGLFNRKKKAKQEQSDTTKTKKKTDYDKIVGAKDVTKAVGDFASLYKTKEGKIYMEYPVSQLGRGILVGSTVASSSNSEYCNVGMKYTAPKNIVIEKIDNSIAFSVPNSLVYLNKKDKGMENAMKLGYTNTVQKKFKIEGYNADSTRVLFEITDYLKDLGPSGAGLSASLKADKEHVSFGNLKSFSDNCSLEITQQVDASMQFLAKMDVGKLTVKSTISFVRLPENPMHPRIQDGRVGIFESTGLVAGIMAMPKMSFTDSSDEAKPFKFANRWRLEPVDEDAWKRGELTAVKKPIVWYIDSMLPEDWKDPARRAVLRWNKAFEKIGLKNVMQVRDFPKDDPEFDPDNIKYNCIRYALSSTENAMGPSWVDPTTGEIINASVIVYQDMASLINKWRFVQTAQIDPRVRQYKMPKDVFQESLEYAIAHEIGHTLGLMHNMSASAAIPVEKLRDAEFTRKYGTTASIMDYARFNYVAQPGDKDVSLTPPELGVYDYYAIKWLYTPIYGAKDMWDEAKIAEKWVDEHAGDPWYRYGRQQVQAVLDPTALAEDLGDDPMKAGDYGIKNLKYILNNLEAWSGEKGDLDRRKELYSEIVSQYSRYLNNVLQLVGGIRLTPVKDGTDDNPAVPVSRTVQRKAVQWVFNELANCQWLDRPELTRKFGLRVSASARMGAFGKAFMDNNIQSKLTQCAHLAGQGNAYTIEDYFNDVYARLFSNVSGKKLSSTWSFMQKQFVEQLCNGAGGRGQFMISQGLDNAADSQYSFGEDQRNYYYFVDTKSVDYSDEAKLALLNRVNNFVKAQAQRGPAADRAHYAYLYSKTKKALKDD